VPNLKCLAQAVQKLWPVNRASIDAYAYNYCGDTDRQRYGLTLSSLIL